MNIEAETDADYLFFKDFKRDESSIYVALKRAAPAFEETKIKERASYATDLKSVLDAYGFRLFGENLYFERQECPTQIDKFFEAIVSFITENSFYIFKDGFGLRWKYTFEQGELHVWEEKIEWIEN